MADDFGLGSPVHGGVKNPTGGRFKTAWPWAGVAMKATEALEEEIGGGEVGDEEIGVDIHGLLDDLGGDENAAGRAAGGIFAKQIHPELFAFLALKMGEAAVEETDADGVVV